MHDFKFKTCFMRIPVDLLFCIRKTEQQPAFDIHTCGTYIYICYIRLEKTCMYIYPFLSYIYLSGLVKPNTRSHDREKHDRRSALRVCSKEQYVVLL